LARRVHFPPPESADETGLVAVTRSMNADLLVEAYSRGIFPWSENPVRWYSPDPRAIFLRETVQVPRKIGKAMRHHRLRVTFDAAFEEVVRACSEEHASEGVWIGPQFVRAYTDLHRRGDAHSVEVWQDEALVGGLYGVQLGAMFAGESMFYRVPNASKIAFAYLVNHLWKCGTLYIDAQVLNEHTARLGAVLVHRADFLELLAVALESPCLHDWPRDPPPLTADSV
jgi:leucyl/phenylalanyl-tRNA---protein transferase